ncbi:MAG: hypothetical protein K5796_10330 [Lachnospiraceae bacterium]|jgi:multidrug resistance efflux pump|nr:hypothetical protein [Lachnospiraceae bacterium]
MFGGRKMDGFMDRIAQKFGSAGEVIKANSEAEARTLKESKERIKALEASVEEMKRLSLKCAEINELTTQLAKGAIERLEDAGSASGVSTEEISTLTEAMDGLKAQMEESFKNQEENVHKENVRVYRNVQASIVEELKQQSEAIAAEHRRMEKKVRGTKPIAIIALVFSGVSMVGIIAQLLISLNIISF